MVLHTLLQHKHLASQNIEAGEYKLPIPFIPRRDISIYCFEEPYKAYPAYSFRVSAVGNFNAEGISSSKMKLVYLWVKCIL